MFLGPLGAGFVLVGSRKCAKTESRERLSVEVYLVLKFPVFWSGDCLKVEVP